MSSNRLVDPADQYCPFVFHLKGESADDVLRTGYPVKETSVVLDAISQYVKRGQRLRATSEHLVMKTSSGSIPTVYCTTCRDDSVLLGPYPEVHKTRDRSVRTPRCKLPGGDIEHAQKTKLREM